MSKTIIMLTANPNDTTPLQLTQEIEKIQQALQRNQRDEHFELKAYLAVTPDEVYTLRAQSLHRGSLR